MESQPNIESRAAIIEPPTVTRELGIIFPAGVDEQTATILAHEITDTYPADTRSFYIDKAGIAQTYAGAGFEVDEPQSYVYGRSDEDITHDLARRLQPEMMSRKQSDALLFVRDMDAINAMIAMQSQTLERQGSLLTDAQRRAIEENLVRAQKTLDARQREYDELIEPYLTDGVVRRLHEAHHVEPPRDSSDAYMSAREIITDSLLSRLTQQREAQKAAAAEAQGYVPMMQVEPAETTTHVEISHEDSSLERTTVRAVAFLSRLGHRAIEAVGRR